MLNSSLRVERPLGEPTLAGTDVLGHATHVLSLEVPALPVALFLALKAVGITLATRVREGRALARVGVEVPLAQLLITRALKYRIGNAGGHVLRYV